MKLHELATPVFEDCDPVWNSGRRHSNKESWCNTHCRGHQTSGGYDGGACREARCFHAELGRWPQQQERHECCDCEGEWTKMDMYLMDGGWFCYECITPRDIA
jgi:hypothetical protein